jgi:hypothetical protein
VEEVIPSSLLGTGKITSFLAWLRGLSIDKEDKKQLLMFWADSAGITITGDMLKRAGIE